jgi:SAM-dependent methyltransferase
MTLHAIDPVRPLASRLSARARAVTERVQLFGWQRYCPICESSARKFLGFGRPPRSDARCPWCDSLERHRLLWCYFQRMTDLFDGRRKTMLHFAPEPGLEPHLSAALGPLYITADLTSTTVRERMDVTRIGHPNDSFDVIYCSHVLEHVDDDRRAMAELFRVLKPSGWAVLLVPITAEKTFEDPAVTDPQERLRLFGQEDHVRRYGPDYVDRLETAGFLVRRVAPADFLSPRDIRRMAVTVAAGDIFHCTKGERRKAASDPAGALRDGYGGGEPRVDDGVSNGEDR